MTEVIAWLVGLCTGGYVSWTYWQRQVRLLAQQDLEFRRLCTERIDKLKEDADVRFAKLRRDLRIGARA